ncbi:MAG: DegV family protein [Clostridia bacterium]|nr:DegV family protein [Clostridia bacterium]
MRDYVIFTDSGSDISPEALRRWGVVSLPLSFKFSDSDKQYLDGELSSGVFYKQLREGKISKTAAVNCEAFREKFIKTLDGGKDVLYLGFSSALSSTFNSARLAAEKISKEGYTGEIVTVDTRSASAGLGLIVYLTARKKAEGLNLHDAAAYARGLIKSLCHWFTVDDLTHLKRGGRISPSAAFLGNILSIKPILYMDNGGHLKSHSKARGRRAALEALISKYGELAEKKNSTDIFISHADCEKDAKLLSKMLSEKYGASVKEIFNIGSVIGSHAGAGTIAIFFLGKR